MSTIKTYINTVILRNVKTMTETPGLQYLSFGVMASMIELLGACLDYDDFLEHGLSELRFNWAINHLAALARYRPYSKGQHNLYRHLRCGMAHVGKPGPGVVFTERGDKQDGHKHLHVCRTDIAYHPIRLVLVCEDLFADVKAAATETLLLMGQPGTKHLRKRPDIKKHSSTRKTSRTAFMNARVKIIKTIRFS